jgi:hypothetical protein
MITRGHKNGGRFAWKGSPLRVAWALSVAVPSILLVGCRTSGEETGKGQTLKDERAFITVDFQPGQTLRYKFISSRDIAVDWEPGHSQVQEQSERLEVIVAYTPVEVDPYGISVIEATVESVRATRTCGPGGRSFGTDAVETAQGRTFMLKVDPRGKIVDASQLETLVREMGEKAFRANATRGRIKDPDMIGDFVAGQWFLWDAVSSIKQPAAGVATGQTWASQLSVPTPMVMRKARDVTYRLEEMRQSDDGPVAVIGSTYTLAASAPADWPVPYAGRFQMSGTFGFLGPYEVLGLEGGGAEFFNLEAGRTERREQEYTMRMRASLPPMGVRANPHIAIEQTLTMELMEPEIRNPNIEIRDKSE